MLCITIAKLGGCREEKMITFPASFRSSNYNYHEGDLVSEVHDIDDYEAYQRAQEPKLEEIKKDVGQITTEDWEVL
jgi:hypothetical protein